MGNSTSTKLTQIAKSNSKSKFCRLGKIFQCFKGEEAMEDNLKEANGIDFDELCPELRKNGPTIPVILPSDMTQETDSYNAFHEKLEVSVFVNDFESGDNVSTRATPGLSPNVSFLSTPMDSPRQIQSSPETNDDKYLRDISGPRFDTRNRRFRPKAAKGTRTRPVSNNMDIYLPGAVFAIKVEDQSEGSNMKKTQDQCLFEWMRRCQEAEN